MNVSLPPELIRFVRRKVDSGIYSSASEVVREALRRLALEENGNAAKRERFDRSRVRAAVKGLLRSRKKTILGPDLSLRDLIDEGRA
ncbi:MAG: type II toxin-antitoxin system ParD family antitoxin [Planctomycetes bacterium]|nr:type II toxin-antitoxin system ParD family antitoxin [Planctomycetota bacterium]MBI3847268.1 type II toxin-antitoxin system ParD family antitoxin [Planctomycetota bacterium]